MTIVNLRLTTRKSSYTINDDFCTHFAANHAYVVCSRRSIIVIFATFPPGSFVNDMSSRGLSRFTKSSTMFSNIPFQNLYLRLDLFLGNKVKVKTAKHPLQSNIFQEKMAAQSEVHSKRTLKIPMYPLQLECCFPHLSVPVRCYP